MKKPELLSPVGNLECLYAAIHAGADAVYLSGKLFGARAFANNFENEELIEAIKICHLYGVKCYVTCNTIIYEHEVDKFIEYIDFLHKNNVDAVILQDIGMFDLIRKTYPNLEIHISTQMHIHNLEGVKLLQELNAKRIVLARETSIEKIKEIKNNTNIELEVFVHGALCLCYSGCCYMSTLIGARSGNRGTCSQCCRLNYNIIDEKGNILNKGNKYPLSTKELCTINDIGKLIDIGIESFKIEGRMKSPEYVYLVTSLYRKAIDNYLKYKETKITKEDINEIKKIFNRQFTKGFIFNETNNNFTNSYKPNHQGIPIGRVIDYKNKYCYVLLNHKIKINDGIRILDDEDYGLILNNFYINKKLVKEANKNDIISFKTNKTINKNKEVLLTYDSNQYKEIKYKIINNPKKIPLDLSITSKNNKLLITAKDIDNNKIDLSILTEQSINNNLTKETIINKLSKLNNTIYKLNKIDINIDNNIFIPLSKLNEIRREIVEKINNKRLYKTHYKKEKYTIELPDFKKVKEITNKRKELNRVMDNYNNIDKNNHYLVKELGALYKLKNIDTDFSLNIVNSYSVAFLHSLGVNKICLSYELNYNQIKQIINEYHKRYNKHPNLEVIVNGYQEAMISKFSLNKLYNKEILYLEDRFKNKYKITTKDNIMTIYNYKKLKDNNNYYEIGVNYIRK